MKKLITATTAQTKASKFHSRVHEYFHKNLYPEISEVCATPFDMYKSLADNCANVCASLELSGAPDVYITALYERICLSYQKYFNRHYPTARRGHKGEPQAKRYIQAIWDYKFKAMAAMGFDVSEAK